MATVTMNEILDFRRGIGSFLQLKLPLPVAYKLNKLNSATEKEVEFYQEKFNEIVQQYAKKDENGNLVFSEDGEQIMIQDDKIAECNQALEELLDLEVEVNTYDLSIENFGDNIECTAEEIAAITPFLND